MGAPLPEMWNPENEPAQVPAAAVTLVEGSSFCISSPNGDMDPALPHGLFVRDTRIISSWSLTVNELPLEPLVAGMEEPYRAQFVCRVPRTDGHADSPLIVERLR